MRERESLREYYAKQMIVNKSCLREGINKYNKRRKKYKKTGHGEEWKRGRVSGEEIYGKGI